MKIKYRNKIYELVEDDEYCYGCAFLELTCFLERDDNGNRITDYCKPLLTKSGYKARIFKEVAP